MNSDNAWSRLPRWAWAGIPAAAALLLLVYLPPVLELKKLGREWNRLRIEGRDSREMLDRFYRSGSAGLPESDDLPLILEKLHQKALQQQVEIRSVTPGSARPAESEGLVAFPVELQLQGEYGSLGRFLSELKDVSELGAVKFRRLTISRDEAQLPVLRAVLSIEISVSQSQK